MDLTGEKKSPGIFRLESGGHANFLSPFNQRRSGRRLFLVNFRKVFCPSVFERVIVNL
jgi:hypothetical protein